MRTVNADIFNVAYCLVLDQPKMGNRRKVSRREMDKVQVEADKRRFRASKQLIESPEYDTIIDYQRQVYNWVVSRCPPVGILKGLKTVRKEFADEITQGLADFRRTLKEELVPQLQKVYPDQVEASRVALNGFFREQDYPSVDKLPELFDIKWNYIDIKVPEGLPAGLRQEEEAKLRKQFDDAGKELLAALREGFKALVDHAIERLTVKPGEKPKKFEETTITNIQGFIATFKYKNLFDDRELEAVVKQAEQILTNVAPEEVDAGKVNVSDAAVQTRKRISAQFAQVKQTLDTLVVNTPSRQFNFDEED